MPPLDQPALERLAATIAAQLRPGDAVLLIGDLGAGKTTFLRALIRAACGDPALEVPSPSYTLLQSYAAPGLMLHHFDLWRLSDAASLAELGWDEAREGVVLVEWPDRLGDARPPDALEITLTPAEGDLRQVRLHGWANRMWEKSTAEGLCHPDFLFP